MAESACTKHTWCKMHGWVREMDEAYREVNGEYAVLVRTLNTKLGTVKHAAIRNATETDITWSEKQRIKMKFLERKNKRLNFFQNNQN